MGTAKALALGQMASGNAFLLPTRIASYHVNTFDRSFHSLFTDDVFFLLNLWVTSSISNYFSLLCSQKQYEGFCNSLYARSY